MPININLPPNPRLDGSLLPYLNTFSNRVRDAFLQLNATFSGTTAQRTSTTGVTGATFYDTTLNRLYVWNGTTWILPYPLGILTRASLTANSAAFTAIIYPLTTTAVAIEAGRRTKVSVHANVQSATAGASPVVCVCDAGGTIANQAYRIVSHANTAEQVSVDFLWNNLAPGNYQFRLGAYAGVSSIIPAGPTASTSITVEDCGPV